MLVNAVQLRPLELFEQTLKQIGQPFVKSVKRKESKTYIKIYLDHKNQAHSGNSEWIFSNVTGELVGKTVEVGS